MFLSLRSKPLDTLDFSCDCSALETYPLARKSASGFCIFNKSFVAALQIAKKELYNLNHKGH